MSIYPRPNSNTNTYNDNDYDTLPNHTHSNTNEDIDLSNYVKKTGDVLSGSLTIPLIYYSGDNSIQHTAFTNELKSDIHNIKNNTQNINYISSTNETSINYLKTNEINLNGIKQSQAFTNNDKSKIYENDGNIIQIKDDIARIDTTLDTHSNNIATNNNDILALQSQTQHITTTSTKTNFSSDVNIDNDITFEDAGVVYGKIGKTTDTSTALVIQTSGQNNDIFINTFGGLVRFWCKTIWVGSDTGKIFMNGEYQNYCYTNEDRTMLYNNNTQVSNLDTQVSNLDTRVTTLETNTNTNNNDGNPIGTVLSFAGPNIPSGYLFCHGQTLLITNYQALYDVIGTTYNRNRSSPAPSGYFYLPDLRQCAIMGAGSINTSYSRKIITAQKQLGEFNQMSVQEHTHISHGGSVSVSNSGNISMTNVGNDADRYTRGTYYNDGTTFQSGETQPNNVAMNYIIKY